MSAHITCSTHRLQMDAEAHGILVQLRRTMRLILTEHDWWHLPRFALGISAGGAQAMILAARFPFQVPKPSASL